MTTIEHRLPPGYRAGSLRADVRAGLTATPKSLPPKWCYDARGSALFEKITELPEYYPTRAECSILRAVSPQSVRIPDLGLTVQFAAGEEMRTDEDDRYGVSLSVPVQPTRVPILLLATDQLLKVS